MLPDPLHPAAVHIPLALAVLLPPVSLIAWLAIRRGLDRRSTWLWVVGMSVVLSLSAWLAVETGEEEEEVVERIVAERAIEAHEDLAHILLLAAVVTLVLAAAGLLAGPVGCRARLLTLVAALFLAVSAVRVGSSGGELVYVHGAASAYTGAEGGASHQAAPRHEEEDDD